MLSLAPTRRLILLSALALCPLLAAPASSLGATATVSGSYQAVKYTASKGEQNRLTVSYRKDKYTLVDRGATIKAGRGCKRKTARRVVCSRKGRIGRYRTKYKKLMIDLKDGDDSIKLKGAPKPYFFALRGGAGDDEVTCSRVKATRSGRFSPSQFEDVASNCPRSGYGGRTDAPGSNPDRDGDGARGTIDCDETNPNVYNGAPDPPGNGVDENCNGVDG